MATYTTNTIISNSNIIPTFLFPIEVSEEIITILLGRNSGYHDVINLSCTCKVWRDQIFHLWKKMFTNFFKSKIDTGTIPMSQLEYCKQFNRQLKQCNILSANVAIEGAWVTTPEYFKKNVKSKSSKFKECLYLDHVWWFDIHCSFEDVFPGKYELIWCIKQGSGYPLTNANLWINDKSKPVGHYEYKRSNVNKWVCVSFGEVNMTSRSNLVCGMIHLAYQSDLYFDYIELIPIP